MVDDLFVAQLKAQGVFHARLRKQGHGLRVHQRGLAVHVGHVGKAALRQGQAAVLPAGHQLLRQHKGQPPQGKPYVYRDYGSLVSFGQTTSVGSLMGSLKGLSWFVDGFVARMMYVSLHLMHHKAVLGTVRTAVLAVARFLIKRTTPLVKLH